MLLNAAKCQGLSFYCVWVSKGEPIGGKTSPPPPRLGLSWKLVLRPILKKFSSDVCLLKLKWRI